MTFDRTEPDEALRLLYDDLGAPIATWNADSPEQLAEVIAGVTRMGTIRGGLLAGPDSYYKPDGTLGLGTATARDVVRRLEAGENPFEFVTEARDQLTGQFTGRAIWRARYYPGQAHAWRLHLLETEPEGVA
jgi:hypothetical protein